MALTMTLNGSNYVSDRTRGAFEQALEEARGKRQESANRESASQPVTHSSQLLTPSSQLATLNSQLVTLDHALAQSYEHQMLTMRVHEQYLNNQGEYARLFGQLMQQQGTIFAQAAAIPQQAEMTAAVLETLARSMARFHDLQEQTLDVHRQFLAQQSEYARATMQLLAGQRISESANQRINESTNQRVVETVKRGNGNGNGNGNGHHPQEAESRGQDAGSIRQDAGSTRREPADSPILQSLNLQSSNPPIPESPNPSIAQSLIPSLLAIVSEKTGYPADMLELDMDMEADLGIDSIKRVEILGALQDAHPDLPEVATDVLAELRTLRQIVERMQEAGGKGQAPGIMNHESANQRIGESADSEPITRNSQLATRNSRLKKSVTRAAHGIARREARLRALPAPDLLQVTLPEGHICLITDDGTPLTAALTDALTARGWRVVVWPHASDAAQVASILEAHGPIAAFIHLNPPGDNALFSAADEARLKDVFLLAGRLKPTLTDSARRGWAAWMTVTRLDGALGLRGGGSPVAGGFFGLTKTLALEWPDVHCRAVDLALDLPVERAVACILAELHDPNRRLIEVGWSAAGRVTIEA
ncbi:MAG: phosphopantetheine-binding protein [Anaerolineae bacterium]